MGRPKSKNDLIAAAENNYEKLIKLISDLSVTELTITFDFSRDEKKREAHWMRDKNLRDIMIHIYEWHQLLLTWVQANLQGTNKAFLPEPYNWKTYGEMNVEFWKKHQNTSLEKATKLAQKSHDDVLNLANRFSNEDLFTKDVYQWVGGSTLGSYFISTTASHYDWASKKLKGHIKNCRK